MRDEPKITPIYITESETASLLRRGVGWLRQHSEQLERQYGFPKIDPAVGRRHRPSIEAWALKRNQRMQSGYIGGEDNQENRDAL